MRKPALAAILSCSLASAAPAHAGEPLPDPAQALRPYYAALARQVSLPTAGANPALPANRLLTRIAFGSCNQQSGPQGIWNTIRDAKPQAFLMIGDNVYGDTGWDGGASLQSQRDAYATLAGRTEFARFRRNVPMMATWDDHDFGLNDSGAVFPFREWAETIHETFWDSRAEVRARPGVYDSAIFGPKGKRVQVIMLDTRFFRSPLKRRPWQSPAPKLGWYPPDTSESAQVLGDAQWQWLASELAKPAEVRIIASSIQVLTEAHGYESWHNFPRERERLFAALKARNGGAIALLSGDRHIGALYSDVPEALGEEVWELTSSSLNAGSAATAAGIDAREPDTRRRGPATGAENFGLIDVDWQKRALILSLRDRQGGMVASHAVPLRR